MKTAYFDHAATTSVDPRIAEEIARLLGHPLNPSSVHQSGQRARRILEDCRRRAAAVLGIGDTQDLIFLSGATEAANLALRGPAAAAGRPLRVASSPVEHSCVRETLASLESAGNATVEPLPVGEDGRVLLPDEAPAGTDALSLMAVNNETGVRQDLHKAREFCGATGSLWVCDAAQAVGKIDVNVESWGADLLIASSHKIGGPPGVGLLAGKGVGNLPAQITGGRQEGERRAGTEPVALIAGFVKALEIASEERGERCKRLKELELALLDRLREAGVEYLLNGGDHRLPGFLNLSFPGLEAMDVVIALDQMGVHASPGSACSTGVVGVSPVLAAMYPDDPARAAGGVRISMGRETSPADVERLAEGLRKIALGGKPRSA